MLSGRIAQKYGHDGLPDDTIYIRARGTAGQSFGAWLARGVTIELQGEGNDYVGKACPAGGYHLPPAPQRNRRLPPEHHRRQHGFVRRDCRGMFLQRGGRRAILRAQLRRGRGDRGRRRSRLRIHDRRRGSLPRPHRAKLPPPGCPAESHIYSTANTSSARIAIRERLPRKISADAGPAAAAADNMPDDMPENMADNLLDDLSIADETRLKRLIERHAHHTNSRIAKTVLRQWPDYLGKFVKVMPVDYRRALQRLRPQNKVALVPAAVARHGSHHG